MSKAILFLFLFAFGLVSAGDIASWQGQYYTGTTFNQGSYLFAFTVYDNLTAGASCWTNSSVLLTGYWGQWQYTATNVSTNCNNASKDYYVEISIDGVVQTPRRLIKTITDAKYVSGNATLNNLNVSENINLDGNIISYGYLFGQPLLGMMGSGLIHSTDLTNSDSSDLNVTCTGLSCTHNNFTVRLLQGNSAQFATYCDVPSGTLTVPDNTFAAYYVNSTCQIVQTTYDDWFTNQMEKGGAWDFAYILTQNGGAEVIDSVSLEQRRLMKLRTLNYYTQQSKVISGFGITVPATIAAGFNVTSGKTVFGMDVVDVNAHIVNSTAGNHVEMVGHGGSPSNWTFNDANYLNITHCDDGSSIVSCTGNGWRRHFIFTIGYDGGLGSSELHALYPLLSTTYYSAANCLDTTTSPLTYTIPNQYKGANVMLYAYCAQRTATTWSTANFIDMRTVKTGSATGGTDISGLVPYTGATTNVNLGTNTLTTQVIINPANSSLNMTWNSTCMTIYGATTVLNIC